MVTRTINRYNVEVKALAQIDEETYKLQTVASFECEFCGKPTETELRKMAKAQNVEMHKGYKINAVVIGSEVWGMTDEEFMAHARRIK